LSFVREPSKHLIRRTFEGHSLEEHSLGEWKCAGAWEVCRSVKSEKCCVGSVQEREEFVR
jgi:hypothetical protein